MPRHLETLSGFSQRAVLSALACGSADAPRLAVDATTGNGHDTLFLAKAVGKGGTVWAFDVQTAALAFTQERLLHAQEDELADRVILVAEGHENLARVLPPGAAGRIKAAMFNLGFLPGSDKNIVTTPVGTVRALEAVADFLAPGGVVSVHCYTGHQGGREETEAVSAWCTALPWSEWRTARYELANKARNQEILFLLEKLDCDAG